MGAYLRASTDRQKNEQLDKDVPVPGTYKTVDPNPQGLRAVLIAPIAGFYNPDSNQAAAIDVALFVLIIGGFLGVVTKTGAIDAGIGGAMSSLKGREKWMIPILMALFAAGGTIYGMAEESLAFYALIIPVMIAAGYDALTAVAIIMLGAGVGTLGSTINPFATVIASNAAGVPFTNGHAVAVPDPRRRLAHLCALRDALRRARPQGSVEVSRGRIWRRAIVSTS